MVEERKALEKAMLESGSAEDWTIAFWRGHFGVSNVSEGRRGCGLVRFVMLEFICLLGVFIARKET